MTTDENIMEEMLGRATNPARETVDELGLQMFCMVIRSNSQLVEKAQKMIMTKIRSTDVTEATRAIALLEECMTNCGTDFQDEASKFRFLNQLIMLVSKKHQGGETPIPIKQRVMECLLLWTTEFPDKNKIREVYDMLKKEGGVEHGNTPAAVAKRESIFGIDEEMLSKLINSGDPENFKRANLLIQHRVNQESQRTTLICQYKGVLQEIQNTVDLLNQMLDTYENDVSKEACGDGGGEADSVNLIRELFMVCKSHKPLLQRLPELIGNTNDELVSDTFEVNDLLLAVMKRYKNTIVHPMTTRAQTATTTAATTAATKTSADLLGELLADTQLKSTATTNPDNDTDMLQTSNVNAAVAPRKTATTTAVKQQTSVNTLEELHEIFGDVSNIDSTTHESDKNLNEIFANINLLEPINVFNATAGEKLGATGGGGVVSEKRSGGAFRELPEIDQLSAELFKKSLPMNDRVCSFKKEPEKFSLNDLVKEKMIVKPTTTAPTTPTKAKPEKTDDNDDDRILTNEIDSLGISRKHEDDLMLTTADHEKEAITTNENNKNSFNLPAAAIVLPIKHLSEITIDLDDVTPVAEERLLLDDDDMKLTLNFTEDRPSKHVSVIVISACNKSKLAVKDFQFEASVKKPCKVRLLAATDSSMPPYKPFRPATPINQVLLLLNPTGGAVDITCIVGYKLGDDPDAVKESIVAKNIPFVE